jgi:hypothetical protein
MSLRKSSPVLSDESPVFGSANVIVRPRLDEPSGRLAAARIDAGRNVQGNNLSTEIVCPLNQVGYRASGRVF